MPGKYHILSRRQQDNLDKSMQRNTPVRHIHQATGKKWRGKMCLAFLFRVSLYDIEYRSETVE